MREGLTRIVAINENIGYILTFVGGVATPVGLYLLNRIKLRKHPDLVVTEQLVLIGEGEQEERWLGVRIENRGLADAERIKFDAETKTGSAPIGRDRKALEGLHFMTYFGLHSLAPDATYFVACHVLDDDIVNIADQLSFTLQIYFQDRRGKRLHKEQFIDLMRAVHEARQPSNIPKGAPAPERHPVNQEGIQSLFSDELVEKIARKVHELSTEAGASSEVPTVESQEIIQQFKARVRDLKNEAIRQLEGGVSEVGTLSEKARKDVMEILEESNNGK